MNEKILDTVRSMLGPSDQYKHFDNDILIHINSAIGVLAQVGVRPTDCFIATSDTTWADYLLDDKDLEIVKLYIYLKVKTLFDPPSNSFVLDAMSKELKELEWRIDVATSD